MPKKSPYTIVLSSDEKRELAARAAKYSLPYFQVQRAKMILLASEGLDSDNCSSPRHATQGRLVVVQEVLRKTSPGPGRTPSPGSPPVFPPRDRDSSKGVGL